MIEVRQVREDELDAMLTCMTTAFGVPKEAWADGFYNGPYNDTKWKRVVVVDGKVVSCLVIIPADVYLGGSTVSMGGIAGVATLPDECKHGYAGMLLEDSVQALRDLGFATSGLFPFSFGYYRKYGWEYVSHRVRIQIKPGLLPTYREASRVRPCDKSDLPAMMRLYHEYHRDLVGPFVRDEQHWRRHIMWRVEDAFSYDNGGVQGYLLGRRAEEDGERRYLVQELVTGTDEARRGLVGHLARVAGVDRIAMVLSQHSLDALNLCTPRAPWEDGYSPRSVIRVAPGFMFRVVDLKHAMESLIKRIDYLEDDLMISVDDQIGTWNNDPVTIRGGRAPEVISAQSPNWVKADIRAFSQVYTGYMSAADAFSLGRIEVSGPEALHIAEQLFPQCEPYVPLLDEY